MAKKKLNVGMIGYGFMGRTHSNAFSQVGHFFDTGYQPVLKTICARDAEKGKAFADQWGYESSVTDWRKLVDDKTSYEASQGYVVFTAKTKFDIAEGTVVPNQAHIFFDANAPVITNAVKNTIVTSLPCPDNALTQDGPWLVATEGGNQYTWIDCSNEQILEQSDAPLYKPEKNGSYRVAVKGDYCTVESECIPFVVNSVSDIKDGLLIYPTLVNDVFYIQSEQAVEKITLSSLSGVLHTLPSQWLGNNLTSVTLPAVASGYYVVAVVTKGRVYTRGVVKM